MILRPVKPQSPTGPPMTKRPVGLIRNSVLSPSISAGSTGLMTRSINSREISACFTPSSCWLESTTASIALGLPPV